jgi:hypothetical protein
MLMTGIRPSFPLVVAQLMATSTGSPSIIAIVMLGIKVEGQLEYRLTYRLDSAMDPKAVLISVVPPNHL